MIVTASLARGAVREAVRLSSAQFDAMWEKLARTDIQAPATHRRFGEWFRKHRAIHDEAALLIVFGKIGRRRGAFSAFTPLFEEAGGGWGLEIKQLSVHFSPGKMEHISLETLPVAIDGHALERMFQRTDSIQWLAVRDCLAAATVFLNTAIPAYIAAGCKQCAIPAEKGLLVGHVIGDRLMLKTFLPAAQLQTKWQALLSDLNAFTAQHKAAIETAALVADDEAATGLASLLRARKHKWLQDSYIPGADALEDAWRSRDQSVAE
jgi:hypothetical protein